MVKEVEFPKWKGHTNLKGTIELIRTCCYNDPDEILKYAAEMYLERTYFFEMLLYVQNRIQKHIEEGEGLDLGIDSSQEIFEGLMLVPAEYVDKYDKYGQFIEDMKKAGIDYDIEYHGRFFYHGPAVRTKEKGHPTLQEVIHATKVKLQWDQLGLDYIVYPN